MRKYAVVSVPLELPYSGLFITLIRPVPDDKLVILQMPKNFVVNRVTFHNCGVNGLSPAPFLLNVRPPQHTRDGVIVQSNFDVVTNYESFAQYTFENFNGESIENDFYLVNIDPNPGNAKIYVTVIIEGYER